ncbi:hypothetical protein PLESTM_001104500 [Pleodorina starrii]|nr:hypothetical protein PLESTM_001104500 [Pleodorina starrii]
MGPHPYLRFLARVSARQPMLRPPPDACLTPVSPSDLFTLMPYTHPISGYRCRSFELRQLELRVAERTSNELPPRGCGSPEQPPASGSDRVVQDSGGAAAAPATSPSPAVAPAIAPAIAAGNREKPLATAATATGSATATSSNSSNSGCHDGSRTDKTGSGDVTPPRPRPLHHHPQPHREARQEPATTTTATTTTAPSVGAAAPVSPQTAAAAATAPAAATASAPPHSYMEVHYPFASLPWLWRQYHRPGFPGLNPALIIEDFDTFAADVAARHVGLVPDSMLVTAFLERLTWHLQLRPGDGLAPPPPPAAAAAGRGVGFGGGGGGGGWRRLAPLAPTDMRLAGQVTWVGRSSMEVLLQLTTAAPPAAAAAAQPPPPPPPAAEAPASPTSPLAAAAAAPPPLVVLPPGQLVATAEFVMALRDSSLRRAVDVPPLHPRDALERELFHRGREHQRQRQARRDRDRGDAPVLPPPRGPAAAATAAAAAAAGPRNDGTAAEAPDGLTRMLYDSLLRSEMCRTVPTDTEALRLLEPEPPEPEPEEVDSAEAAAAVAADGPPPPPPSSSSLEPGRQGGGAKRPRLDSADSAARPTDSGSSPPLDAVVGGDDDRGDRRRKPSRTAAAAPPGTEATPIRQTEVHRTVIAEFQDRNTSGTVFGGHLLRLAYEHAATAAAAHAGAPCELLWMEEGAISSPARVGDVLHAVARVVWTEPAAGDGGDGDDGRALRVVVRVGKYDVAAPTQHVLALTLTAVFLAPGEAVAEVGGAAAEAREGGGSGGRGGGGLRQVAPTTLTEAAEALAAQRRHEAVMAALVAAEAAEGDPALAAAASAGHDP